MVAQPLHCRPNAYAFFREQLPHLETADGLLAAATAIAAHEMDDANPTHVLQEIDALANRVASRVAGRSTSALAAHLHEVLFEEEGFAGNTSDYYNARNSYLPAVLDSKRGLPIVLVLIYKSVGDRLGLSIEGISTPGHFMGRVLLDDTWTLVDPFYGGRLLARDEAVDFLTQVLGVRPPESEDIFSPVSHRLWLWRMLKNLQLLFGKTGRHDDQAAMQELAGLLQPLR